MNGGVGTAKPGRECKKCERKEVLKERMNTQALEAMVQRKEETNAMSREGIVMFYTAIEAPLVSTFDRHSSAWPMLILVFPLSPDAGICKDLLTLVFHLASGPPSRSGHRLKERRAEWRLQAVGPSVLEISAMKA